MGVGDGSTRGKKTRLIIFRDFPIWSLSCTCAGAEALGGRKRDIYRYEAGYLVINIAMATLFRGLLHTWLCVSWPDGTLPQ